jgi:hypothetical protein
LAQYNAILADIVDGTVVVPFAPAELTAFLTQLGYGDVAAALVAKIRAS